MDFLPSFTTVFRRIANSRASWMALVRDILIFARLERCTSMGLICLQLSNTSCLIMIARTRAHTQRYYKNHTTYFCIYKQRVFRDGTCEICICFGTMGSFLKKSVHVCVCVYMWLYVFSRSSSVLKKEQHFWVLSEIGNGENDIMK